MKKVLSMLLAVMLIIGLTPAVFAAPTSGYKLGTETSTGQVGGTDEYRPDSAIWIQIVDANGNAVTKKEIKEKKIDVKVRTTKGSKIVRDVKVDYKNLTDTAGQIVTREAAFVRIRTIEKFVSTKEMDFELTVFLTENKERLTEEKQVSGVFKNAETTVTDSDDYVYLGNTPVVEAEEYIKSIEVEIGDGVTIFTKMFEGKRYYGHAEQDIKEADADITEAHPTIETIYYLETIGLNAPANRVVLDIDDANMYVYNANLEFVGMSDERLPYSTKYYVSSAELDIADEEPEEPEEPEVPKLPPNTGGDDLDIPNANLNPSTGR